MIDEDLSPGETVIFNHDKLKAFVIALTETGESVIIFKHIDERMNIYKYPSSLEYNGLLMYTYSQQDASLLFARAFSHTEKWQLEKEHVVPSSLKEVVSDKLLLMQSDIRFLNRNVPPTWELQVIIDITRNTSLKSVLLVDYRIGNLDILCVIKHQEDYFNIVIPMLYLSNLYKAIHEL